jgi:putative addiction module component (TIGR02574 family)
MTPLFEEIENKAMLLSSEERQALIKHLLVSLDSNDSDSTESIVQAWDAEIARRVADMEAGRTRWIPSNEFMTKLRARIEIARAHADQS